MIDSLEYYYGHKRPDEEDDYEEHDYGTDDFLDEDEIIEDEEGDVE